MFLLFINKINEHFMRIFVDRPCEFYSLKVTSSEYSYLYLFFLYLHIIFLFVSITEEQERVQKKTFVNWINSYLSKVRNLKFEMKIKIISCHTKWMWC